MTLVSIEHNAFVLRRPYLDGKTSGRAGGKTMEIILSLRKKSKFRNNQIRKYNVIAVSICTIRNSRLNNLKRI